MTKYEQQLNRILIFAETHGNTSDKLAAAEVRQGASAELREAAHIMLELHGVIVEYQQLPCKSLEDRMLFTAQRYGKRLTEIATRVREPESGRPTSSNPLCHWCRVPLTTENATLAYVGRYPYHTTKLTCCTCSNLPYLEREQKS